MKEHGLEGPAEAPGRALKSLLKKPGQTKAKGQKNRVVINEKLNEFFAADYIILIKEECCADYEEECDCCCQEHEMIRLGNCKECRAELNLHFAEEPHFVVDEVDIDDTINRTRVFHQEDEGDEEEDDDEDDDDDDDDDEADEDDEEEEEQDKRTSLRKLQQRQHHQRETLSPPEGYKDLCLANDLLDEDQPVCAECDYYQRANETESTENNENVKSVQDATSRLAEDESIQHTIDQAQQTTPDMHQRYLVETITMTTVTERRIVREISEEETTRNSSTDEIDQLNSEEKLEGGAQPLKDESNQDVKAIEVAEGQSSDKIRQNAAPETGEPALTLKLAANSLKPNSAVRQLFPDQRFISPPSKGGGSISLDDESADAEAQKFLITTESLRLFDSAKRAGRGKRSSRSDSSAESDSSSIKRTIERNALRRSLICKFDTASRKKNLRSKDLTLEERIRQLTCVDVDETAEHELPARTSPSGEEHPRSATTDEAAVAAALTTATTTSTTTAQQPSTYRKITELFSPKKPLDLNLPDIGLGNKVLLGRTVHKINSDARKQFLASLAPLSCVASTAVDNRDDYYRISAKLPIRARRDPAAGNRNSDDSYSLEDIETALKANQTNYNCTGAPPDVTRGTPTSHGPDDTDSIGDELLAFVEQDKSRTERIKRRYNDSGETNGAASSNEKKNNREEDDDNDDDDDELNDYGFNKRPSVRGIKAQFSSSSDIVQQIRARTISNVFPDRPEGMDLGEDAGVENAINRLNGTHKIDDVYQTIAETTLSMKNAQERGAYINSTLPRSLGHVQVGENCAIYTDQKNGIQYQEQGGRLLRIAGGSDGVATYGTLPTKGRRHPAYGNYHCNVFPAANGKCYRTMYFVPYDGLTDPTYQNLQRIMPAQTSTANYANHIERYPYPRNGRLDQQQAGYYVRPNGPQLVPNQPQALHVHVHQSDEFHVTPAQNVTPSVHQVHPMHLQHHHQHQPLGYNVQSIPGYSVITPVKGATPYSYQVQLNRGTSDVQMQTITLPPTIGTNCSQPMSTFTGTTQVLGTVMSSSLTSSVLSSPTKMIQQQKKESCAAAERGVPEGAVSAPAHDYTQNSLMSGAFLGASGNVPPPNTQNSVYYAMNV